MDRGKSCKSTATSNDSQYSEVLHGVPLVEILGQRRVLVENHCGIMGYGCTEVIVKVRCGNIRICGENLRLARMSREKLVVTGKIHTVNLSGR